MSTFLNQSQLIDEIIADKDLIQLAGYHAYRKCDEDDKIQAIGFASMLGLVIKE